MALYGLWFAVNPRKQAQFRAVAQVYLAAGPADETQYRQLRSPDLLASAVERLNSKPAGVYAAESRERLDPASLAARTTVAPAGPTNRTVALVVTAGDPLVAADLANAIAETYVDRAEAAARAQARAQREQVAGEISQIENRIAAAERDLVAAAQVPTAAANATIVEGLQAAVIAARKRRISTEAAWHAVERSARLDEVTVIAREPIGSAYRTQLSQQKELRAQLLSRYGEHHPAVIAVQAEIEITQSRVDDAERHMAALLRQDYVSALRQEQQLAGELEARKAEADVLERALQDRAAREEALFVARGERDRLVRRERELQAFENLQTSDARIVRPATPPAAPADEAMQRAWSFFGLAAICFAATYLPRPRRSRRRSPLPRIETRRHRPRATVVPPVPAEQPPRLTTRSA